MTAYLGPNPMVDELIGRIGSLLVGRRTFGGDDPHRGTDTAGKPFGGGCGCSTTRTAPRSGWSG